MDGRSAPALRPQTPAGGLVLRAPRGLSGMARRTGERKPLPVGVPDSPDSAAGLRAGRLAKVRHPASCDPQPGAHFLPHLIQNPSHDKREKSAEALLSSPRHSRRPRRRRSRLDLGATPTSGASLPASASVRLAGEHANFVPAPLAPRSSDDSAVGRCLLPFRFAKRASIPEAAGPAPRFLLARGRAKRRRSPRLLGAAGVNPREPALGPALAPPSPGLPPARRDCGQARALKPAERGWGDDSGGCAPAGRPPALARSVSQPLLRGFPGGGGGGASRALLSRALEPPPSGAAPPVSSAPRSPSGWRAARRSLIRENAGWMAGGRDGVQVRGRGSEGAPLGCVWLLRAGRRRGPPSCGRALRHLPRGAPAGVGGRRGRAGGRAADPREGLCGAARAARGAEG